jgi:hypothetical protein
MISEQLLRARLEDHGFGPGKSVVSDDWSSVAQAQVLRVQLDRNRKA